MIRTRDIRVEMPIDSGITMSKMLELIAQLKESHKDRTYYFSGTDYALVSSKWINQATLEDFGGIE